MKDVIRDAFTLGKLMVLFSQYANIDGWTPDKDLNGLHYPEYDQRPELDRWILFPIADRPSQ